MSKKSNNLAVFRSMKGRPKSKSTIIRKELSDMGFNPDLVEINGDLAIKLTNQTISVNGKKYEAYATYLSSEIAISANSDDPSLLRPRLVYFHDGVLVSGSIVNNIYNELVKLESESHLDNQIQTLYKVVLLNTVLTNEGE